MLLLLMRGGVRECTLGRELLLGLRLGLLLLEGARGIREAVLAALLEEVGGGLGHDCPLVWQTRISWHDVALGHPEAWIRSAVWAAEGRVGTETWRTLRRLTCTRCEHTVRLS